MPAKPLLADRAASPSSDAMEEEDALLTGRRKGDHFTKSSKSRWRELGLFAWAILATIGVVALGVLYQQSLSRQPRHGKHSSGIPSGKRNLIFMVSDGMGPTSLELTRSWRQFTDNLPWSDTLVIDKHLIGQSRTRSTSSLVTDSAAGATAFSCGNKSYNGAISVLPNFEPCASVMEAAKRMGYTTGLVVTTRITDATPAVFAAHVRRREMEDEIALQMIGENGPLGRSVDLMFGGGRCHFLPNSTRGSCRDDDIDVVSIAREDKLGWRYIETKQDFSALKENTQLPLMGLFASGDIPYEIDRRSQDETYPSLEEMTRTALRTLSAATKNTEKGFFVMIEGSRIDHAGHGNDPAAQVHEVLAYDRAMAAVLEFIDETDVPTLMVSTSDHETGGLAAARQLYEAYPRYLWYPGVLANASHSASHTSDDLHHYLDHLDTSQPTSSPSDDDTAKPTRSFLKKLLSANLGIHDASEDEITTLLDPNTPSSYTFADMISRRAQTGWSTHGHSGADVNIYSSDANMARDLVGNHENTDVGVFLRKFLGVEEEFEKVGKILREYMHSTSAQTDDVEGMRSEGESWLGRIPAHDERLDGQDHLQHYHGDHRRKRLACEICGV